VHAKFCEKTSILCRLCKKGKKKSRTKPFLTPIFIFLHITKDGRFFMEQICEHIEYRDICTKLFYPNFLIFQNVFKLKYKIHASGCQNTTAASWLLLFL
jgi:hypothetical protein